MGAKPTKSSAVQPSVTISNTTSLHASVFLTPAIDFGSGESKGKLEETILSLNLPLTDKAPVVSTPRQRVGVYEGKVIEASLSFWYKFTAGSSGHAGKLYICSNQYKGDAEATPTELILFIDGEPNSIIHTNAAATGWVTTVGDLAERLQQSLRTVHSVLYSAGFNAGLVVATRLPPPQLSEEDAKNVGVVVDAEGHVTLHDGSKPIPAGSTFMSILKGKTHSEAWASDKHFANARGTTEDPMPETKNNPKGTWIGLYAEFCGAPVACASVGFFSAEDPFKCSGITVGGHVIPGDEAKYLEKGADVYILPICQRHNAKNNGYMKNTTGGAINALTLTHFDESK